jgi:hypothetical protein
MEVYSGAGAVRPLAVVKFRLWGRMVSCAPIGNRRKLGRLTIGPQVDNLPYNHAP